MDGITEARVDGPWAQAVAELIAAGRELDARRWVPATSGNLSVRVDADRIAMTVSGRHKGRLDAEGVMPVDAEGRSLDPARRPSAECLLHAQIYRRRPDAGAVLHVHSVNATLLSRRVRDLLVIEGYELLKAFPGIDTHAARLPVPVFDNDQDIPRLAGRVEAAFDAHPEMAGYLIAGHGLYAWGRDVEAALRHLEAFDFLFECELRERTGALS